MNDALTHYRRSPLWRPFSRSLFADFDRFFEDGWNPAVDVRETENELIVTADVPGTTREQLKVEVHDGVLTLSGERTSGVERYVGSFSRSFRLPKGYDSELIKAKYENGVLEIFVPKAATTQPKTIEIE